jgi:ABC-type uncharacterized transport system fused permease/ATPase subunit
MEGDFRRLHVSVKESAEQIAFLRGEGHTLSSLSASLGILARQQRVLAVRVSHICRVCVCVRACVFA